MNSVHKQCTTLYTVVVWVMCTVLVHCAHTERAWRLIATRWTRIAAWLVATPRRPDHVTTPKLCRDTNFAQSCCDKKNCVAKPLQLILPLLCHDTNSGLRHHKAKPFCDIKNCVATPNAWPMSHTLLRAQLHYRARTLGCAP